MLQAKKKLCKSNDHVVSLSRSKNIRYSTMKIETKFALSFNLKNDPQKKTGTFIFCSRSNPVIEERNSEKRKLI